MKHGRLQEQAVGVAWARPSLGSCTRSRSTGARRSSWPASYSPRAHAQVALLGVPIDHIGSKGVARSVVISFIHSSRAMWRGRPRCVRVGLIPVHVATDVQRKAASAALGSSRGGVVSLGIVQQLEDRVEAHLLGKSVYSVLLPESTLDRSRRNPLKTLQPVQPTFVLLGEAVRKGGSLPRLLPRSPLGHGG